jgi:hypothetical protein
MDGPPDPVSPLRATTTGGAVVLSWTAPASDDVLGYHIYRNHVLVYTTHYPTTTSYTQTGVPNGNYTYGVAAFYESSESIMETVDVTVSGSSDSSHLPVSNLQGTASLDKVSLQWTKPFSGGWMSIAGTPTTVYSFNQALTLFAGTLWGPEHLQGLNGFDLTQIRFYMNSMNVSVTYKAQVWEVDANGTPILIRTQPYNGTTAGLQTITLNEPVAINVSKEYLVGVEIHAGANIGVLVTDGGTVLPERNWLCVGNEWTTTEAEEIEGNICLSIYLSANRSSASDVVLYGNDNREERKSIARAQSGKTETFSAELLPVKISQPAFVSVESPDRAIALSRYVIYRNGEKVGETFASVFEDKDLATNTTYSYCVSAVYDDGNTSEGVCIELTTQLPVNPYKSAENYKATLTDNKVTLSWSAPFAGGTFGYCAENPYTAYNISGATVIMAARFTPDDLAKLLGLQLSRVSFAVHSSVTTTNTTYSLRIYAGVRDNGPERIIHEQPVRVFRGGTWTPVTLSTPININVYEDLWIGIVVGSLTSGSSVYRMACDAGPAIEGKGNVLFLDNRWTTLSGAGGSDYNWSIQGYATPPAALSGEPQLMTHGSALDDKASASTDGQVHATPQDYLITRNGTAIATVPNTVFTYEDLLPAEGNYVYGITARYADGQSDTHTITVSFGKSTGIVTVDPEALSVYPNPVQSGRAFYVNTGADGAVIQIHSLSGMLLHRQPTTGTVTRINRILPPGIYILSAGEEKTKIVVR